LSKRVDRERVARGVLFRGGHRILVEPGEAINLNDDKTQLLICGKCNAIMSESRITEHLMKCQPLGVTCAKCRNVFPPDKFLSHFQRCKGLAKEFHHGN